MLIEFREVDLVPSELREKWGIFTNIFGGIEGGAISQDERASKRIVGSEFTYGEIEIIHFLPLLKLAARGEGGVFWDLGCGAGKALIAAALSEMKFNKICGVELLDGLYQASKKAVGKYYEVCAAKEGTFAKPSKDLFNVVQEDMRKTPWEDADVIYTSSICFPEELIKSLSEKGKKLKKGTRIITLKKWIDSSVYKVLQNFKVKMTWGMTGVYILEKT